MEYMASSVNKGVEIDPALFFVPDDVIDVRASSTYSDDITAEPEPDLPDSNDVVDDTDLGADESNPDSSSLIQAPQWLSVYSQVVRIGSDGRAVVDVTIEVDDVPGAENYELRVTK